MSQAILGTITDMAKDGQIEHMFSTPVFRYVFKDVDTLNAALRDLILERERTIPSLSKSNRLPISSIGLHRRSRLLSSLPSPPSRSRRRGCRFHLT
jgi:hypothetical protein